jgi:hypothetical protein
VRRAFRFVPRTSRRKSHLGTDGYESRAHFATPNARASRRTTRAPNERSNDVVDARARGARDARGRVGARDDAIASRGDDAYLGAATR